MAKRKRTSTQGNHRKNSTSITSVKNCISLFTKYIEEKGFELDTLSFGAESESWEGGSKSVQVPNKALRYKLVHIDGFNNYLNRNKNYYKMFLDSQSERTKLELNERIRGLMLDHNMQGLSLGHIHVKAFEFWKFQTYERDKIDFTKEMNKIKLETERAKLERLQADNEALAKADETTRINKVLDVHLD